MNLDIKEKNTVLNMDYDFEAYQEIKKIDQAAYNIEGDTWEVDNRYIKSLLSHLSNMNFDVLEQIKLVNNEIQSHSKFNFDEKKEVIKTVKIKVTKENPKSLVLSFDYDPKVLKHVKETDQRVYVPKDKSWKVQKVEIDWLYNKLDELEYVELSDLIRFTSYNEDEISLSESDFPNIKIDPYPFQIDTVKTLLKEKKIINALEAGLGKTAITVMACEYLKKKTLIVCPASVKENWKKEIHQINYEADVNVLYSGDEWVSSQYIVLNYDILEQFKDDMMNEGFEIIAFDEAHKLRGVTGRGLPSSKRAKLALQLADKLEYVFPITATPFINYTKDIFNLLTLIKHPSSKNWYTFANTYCGATRGDFGTSYNGSSNQEKLNSKLYPNYIIRIKTEDHIDLPERVRSFVPVKINMNKYNKAVKKYMDERTNFETNGQHLVHLTAMRKELSLAKAKSCVDMVKDLLEQNKSVVLFTNYTNVVDFLYNKFEKDAVKITGDVDSRDRETVKELFQNGEKKVFIGNIDAAGEGITLTRSHNMIVTDFHWSPVVMVNQMEKRINRITQNHRCLIQYLYVEDAVIDQVQMEMLEEKLNDSSMILDGKSEEFFAEKLIGKI